MHYYYSHLILHLFASIQSGSIKVLVDILHYSEDHALEYIAVHSIVLQCTVYNSALLRRVALWRYATRCPSSPIKTSQAGHTTTTKIITLETLGSGCVRGSIVFHCLCPSYYVSSATPVSESISIVVVGAIGTARKTCLFKSISIAVFRTLFLSMKLMFSRVNNTSTYYEKTTDSSVYFHSHNNHLFFFLLFSLHFFLVVQQVVM